MRILKVSFVISIFLLWCDQSAAKVYLTKDDALKMTFPEAEIERKTIFLTDEDVKKIGAMSKTRLESKLFTYYIARRKEEFLGYAVFGSHIVRTKPEVYMVIINPDGSLNHIKILAFYEPEEYLPPKRWFEQFNGKVLDDNLWTKRGISAVTGATLSANGITEEVRKALAVFQIMILKKGD